MYLIAQVKKILSEQSSYQMTFLKTTLFFSIIISVASCQSTEEKPVNDDETSNRDTTLIKPGHYVALKAEDAIEIDGEANEEIWSDVEWMKMDQVWLGEAPDSLDYSGRFKACWDQNFIYIYTEITDDSLVDTHEDSLDHYWDDDCVEIFVDEDNSDGNHQYNHNAFAYHVALDYTVVDIGPDSLPHVYPHVKAARVKKGNKYYWEMAMSIYDDSYQDNDSNQPVVLLAGKEIGFMIAYCDNDVSEKRENFIGTIPIEGEDKDQGWIDAGVFGSLLLK